MFTKSIWYCTDRIQLGTNIFTRQWHWCGSVKMNAVQNKLLHRTHWFQERGKKKSLTISFNTIRYFCSTKSSAITDPEKNSPKVTDNYLASNGALRVWLYQGEQLPKQENFKKESRCQLHYWVRRKNHRAQLMSCVECNVTLCIHCFNIFHVVEEFVGHKEDIAAQLRRQWRSNLSLHPQVKIPKNKQ